jgi:hypothetical protein
MDCGVFFSREQFLGAGAGRCWILLEIVGCGRFVRLFWLEFRKVLVYFWIFLLGRSEFVRLVVLGFVVVGEREVCCCGWWMT